MSAVISEAPSRISRTFAQWRGMGTTGRITASNYFNGEKILVRATTEEERCIEIFCG